MRPPMKRETIFRPRSRGRRNPAIDSIAKIRFLLLVLAFLALAVILPASRTAKLFSQGAVPSASPILELSRAVRPWEFLSAVGTRAALLGNEAGDFEAWVYPLKLLRHLHLRFRIDGREQPAESLARTVIARPEASTIVYSGDAFAVREIAFVPRHEPGAIIFLNVETQRPIEIEIGFKRDFQLEWPAALGGTAESWDSALHAVILTEEQGKYAALIGSPSASEARLEYKSDYAQGEETSFQLGKIGRGASRELLVFAGSVQGREEARRAYERLLRHADALLADTSDYYRGYLDRTVEIEVPDAQIQQAYDWARVSLAQGLVDSPLVGSGLVAGYGLSGDGQRPGYDWFFGRDALWTSLALDDEGDFGDARQALDFLGRYQRQDGKIPHEVPQTATLVPWFERYPYGFASADATPLFVIAADEYVTSSGDVEFAKQKWEQLWKAHEYLNSTRDQRGLSRNAGIGHGWVESGPLLPVKTEIYQSALATQELAAIARLAQAAGNNDAAGDLTREFQKQRALLDRLFWSPGDRRYAFALGENDRRLTDNTVFPAVPMWFGLLDPAKAAENIRLFAAPEIQADWGTRLISNDSPKYDAGGYHAGSVWPLFTGWTSVGEYRYHRALPAYLNLRANALLAVGGSLGHVTETLSGEFYEPLGTSSPQQVWSEAMVIAPVVEGLWGMQVDALQRQIAFVPHFPAEWNRAAISNIHVNGATLNVRYTKSSDAITFEFTRTGEGETQIDLSPALGARAQVLGATLNGQNIGFNVTRSDTDQHVVLKFAVGSGATTLRIAIRRNFELGYTSTLPMLGGRSAGLRILSETWAPNRDRLTLELAGVAGKQYELNISDPAEIASVEGGKLTGSSPGLGKLLVKFGNLSTIGDQNSAGLADRYESKRMVFAFTEDTAQALKQTRALP